MISAIFGMPGQGMSLQLRGSPDVNAAGLVGQGTKAGPGTPTHLDACGKPLFVGSRVEFLDGEIVTVRALLPDSRFSFSRKRDNFARCVVRISA